MIHIQPYEVWIIYLSGRPIIMSIRPLGVITICEVWISYTLYHVRTYQWDKSVVVLLRTLKGIAIILMLVFFFCFFFFCLVMNRPITLWIKQVLFYCFVLFCHFFLPSVLCGALIFPVCENKSTFVISYLYLVRWKTCCRDLLHWDIFSSSLDLCYLFVTF